MKIVISNFCQGRDQNSCTIPLTDLLPEIEANFAQAKPGYREGVVLVPVNPAHFVGQIVTLHEGDTLHGSFKARQKGEAPRKEIRVIQPSLFTATRPIEPDPLVAVDVVLYSNATLAEDNDNSDPSADWEVIAIITKISDEDQPMPPETLLHNHFGSDGGTKTNMDPAKFEADLRKSFLFWKDKAIIQPS